MPDTSHRVSGRPYLTAIRMSPNLKFETPSKFVHHIVDYVSNFSPAILPRYYDRAYFGYVHGYKFVAFQVGIAMGVLINGEKLWLYYYDNYNNWQPQSSSVKPQYAEPMCIVLDFFNKLDMRKTNKTWRFTKKVADKLFPDPQKKLNCALVCNRWHVTV